MVLVVAAIGVSGSGKTTTLEYLIGKLAAEGLQIGAIKHIHHRGFTMDTEGTNTWRYTQAGSKVVVAISPQEVDVIKKTNRELENLDEIISLLENENLDIIFIEGFHSLIAKRTDIQKIATAKDEADLKRTIEGMAPPVLAASGRIALNTSKTCFGNIPYIAIPQDGQRLVDLIKAELQKQNAKEAAA